MADKWYEIKGAQGGASGATSIILKGTYDNPKEVVAVGQTVQLTDEQYEEFKDLFILKETDAPKKDKPTDDKKEVS